MISKANDNSGDSLRECAASPGMHLVSGSKRKGREGEPRGGKRKRNVRLSGMEEQLQEERGPVMSVSASTEAYFAYLDASWRQEALRNPQLTPKGVQVCTDISSLFF